MLWGPLHFLTFPLLFWEFWKELCFRGTRDGVSVCKKPLARGNCVMLMDFSRLWQFAVFRIWLCGCEGALVLCSSCRFAPCHSSDVMLLCAAVGWSRTALASRALLHPHPAFLKTVCRKVASYWEEVVFPVHTCTDGCNLAFLLRLTFAWESSSLFCSFISTPFILYLILDGEGSMWQEEAERIKDTLGTLKPGNAD